MIVCAVFVSKSAIFEILKLKNKIMKHFFITIYHFNISILPKKQIDLSYIHNKLLYYLPVFGSTRHPHIENHIIVK